MAQSKHADRKSVLVVEDDVFTRAFAVLCIREAGLEVLEASNAHAALNLLKSGQNVAVLFTDIQMPGGVDGLELAREVHRCWSKIQLLVTSGGINPEKGEIPCDGKFLLKPYNPKELIENIEALLEQGKILERSEALKK